MERYLQGGEDRFIGELADRQHGVVAWFQLREAGLSRGVVDFRLAQRRLVKVHRGVYAVGHGCLTWHGGKLAAVLALGRHAVLSHRSAAELHGILPRSARRIDVTLRRDGARRSRRAIAVHHSPAAEATVRDGIPVTTLPWTLLGLAATEPAEVVERAIAGAESARVFDLAAVRPLLDDIRPGVAALRQALERFDGAPVDSELERRFLVLCRDHDVPRPLIGRLVVGLRTDFLWPAERLVVETDGLAYHRSTRARENDEERDGRLALAGYHVQRFGWRKVTEEPAWVASVIRHLLDERRPA